MKRNHQLCIVILSIVIMGPLFYEKISTTSRNNSEIIKSNGSFESPNAQNSSIVDPIQILNESDIGLYADQGTGLSWETAYIISSKIINCNDSLQAISVQNSSRYIIFREISINFMNVSRANTSIAVLVKNSQHIRFEFLTITFEYINPNGWTRSNKSYFYLENITDIEITKSSFANLRHTGITIKNGLNISLLDNLFLGSAASGTGLGWAIESVDCTNLIVANCYFNSIISGLNSETSDNILITGCWFTANYSQISQGSAMSYSETTNVTATNNQFDGYSISISNCADVIIDKNTFHDNSWTQTILSLYSSNRIRFNNNIVWHCRGSVFKMYDSHDISLSKNILFGIGVGLYDPASSLKPLTWNIVLPNLTWIFVGLGLLGILLILAYFIPYQRDHIQKMLEFQKKYEFLQPDGTGEKNSLDAQDQIIYADLLKKLNEFNRKSTRSFSANMLFLLGIIFPFSLRYMVHPESNIFLDIFSSSFDNSWAFCIDFIIWSLIKWGLVIIWLYDIGRKMKRQHIWPPITNKNQKRKTNLGLLITIFTFWWYFTYLALMLFYPPVIAIVLGILFELLHFYFKSEVPQHKNSTLLLFGIFTLGLGLIDIFTGILNPYPYSFNSAVPYIEVAVIFIIGSIFYKISNVYKS